MIPEPLNDQTPSVQTPPQIYDETDGLLFSSRCESARSIATLLSCLRNVSISSNASGAPSLASIQNATQSLLPGTDRRTNQGGGGSGSRGAGGSGKMQYASVFVSDKGLTFQVHGVGRQSRATVDLSAGLFSEFYVAEQTVVVEEEDEDEEGGGPSSASASAMGREEKLEVVKGGEFGINLTTVLGCLLVLGTASLDRTTLCLSYDTSAAIFKIELLEEAGLVSGGGVIISNCAIPGMSVEDDFDDEELGQESGLDHAFRSEPIVARARIQSEFLKAAIIELTDVAGAVSVTVGISKVGLELATFGHCTECHVVVPYLGNHPEVFISLEGVGNDGIVHARSYPMPSILAGMRGLEIAIETCISINGNGMIAIQHQALDKVGNGDPNYIDFIMGCLQEDEDMDEMDDSSRLMRSQTQMSNSQRGARFSPSFSDDAGQEKEVFQESPSRTQTPTRSRRSPHRSRVPHGKSDSQEKGTTPKNNHDDDHNDDSHETLSQESPSLFGAVASISSKNQKNVSRNTRRKLVSNRADNNSDNQSDGSHEVESEFEDSIDVTATLNISRRREDSVSSPRLMYGDMHLEASDDEK